MFGENKYSYLKVKLLFALALVVSINVIGQEANSNTSFDNPRASRRLGLNNTFFGKSGYASISIDFFITPTINVEIGSGILGNYLGATYHFKGKSIKKWTLYSGVFYSNLEEYEGHGIYFPLGYHYQGYQGFTFGIEAAVFLQDEFFSDIYPMWGGVKIGYHFKLGKKKR